MARIGRHVRVTGHVQGVFFRQWTANEAERLGVAGWIRNCPNGKVEARLSGIEEAVERLIDGIRRGPPGASVQLVETDESEPIDGDGFEVRPTLR